MSHATARAKERLGFVPPPKMLLEIIRAGQAKLVAFCEQERLTYDVPFEGRTVRCVVNKELNYVVSVLPPKFRMGQDKLKERQENHSRTKREFFRGFEGEDDDYQTSES